MTVANAPTLDAALILAEGEEKILLNETRSTRAKRAADRIARERPGLLGYGSSRAKGDDRDDEIVRAQEYRQSKVTSGVRDSNTDPTQRAIADVVAKLAQTTDEKERTRLQAKLATLMPPGRYGWAPPSTADGPPPDEHLDDDENENGDESES